MSHKPRGHIFVVSAPSGAGKTTLCRAALNRFDSLRYSISHTTRKPRPGEQAGKDYFFITPDAFEQGIEEGKWVEWARVHDNYYGTSDEFLDRELAAGRDVLLDIDVQGAVQILERYPESVTVFIAPPSMEVLKQRLLARGGDSDASVALRMKNAENEMAQQHKYRHIIVNDRLSEAIDELIGVIASYRKG